MNRAQWITIGLASALALSLTACTSEGEGNRTVIREPGRTITIVDDAGSQAGEPDIAVDTIDPYAGMEISDWLDEDTAVVTIANESLGRMELSELSEQYPRSLYLYDFDTKQYKLLKERRNAHIGGATLSPDKKHLIYQEYTLGDPVYYVMNLETLEEFRLAGEPIGGAISARWTDSDTLIGASYGGGAYTANTAGTIQTVDGLNEGALFLVQAMRNRIYYNTASDESLMALNTGTLEQAVVPVGRVHGVYPAPDGNQMLVLQYNGSKTALILCGPDGEEPQTIAEGSEIGGVSWSPDQRMIAYVMKADANGAAINGLHVHDLLSGKSTPLAVHIDNASTFWSPSGHKLAYTQWKDDQYSSHVVHLKFSLQK